MDVIANLYTNSGLSGVVGFFSGNAPKTTVSVKNVIKNAGLPTETPNTAAVAHTMQKNIQSLLSFYQDTQLDAVTAASPSSPRYIAFSAESVMSFPKILIPPVKQTVKS